MTERGLTTVRDLLLFRPRSYEDRRRLSAVGEVRVGEQATLVAEVRQPRPGRPRRGGRAFSCQLRDASGQMTAIWFRARPWQYKELTTGRRFLFTGPVRLGKGGGRLLCNAQYEPLEDDPATPGSTASHFVPLMLSPGPGVTGPGSRSTTSTSTATPTPEDLRTKREPIALSLSKGQLEDLPPSTHFGRLVPIYPGIAHQRALRSLMSDLVEQVLPELSDPLPLGLRREQRLLGLSDALAQVHFPVAEISPEELERSDSEAHRRLAFDEFLLLSIDLARRRMGLQSVPGFPLKAGPVELKRAIADLPFQLTGAQQKALEEITADLRQPRPMQRLLEGDVGSGKTAVAAVALRLAVESGFQGALMAPTELLAEQHYRSLQGLLSGRGIPLHLITSGQGGAQGPAARTLARGEPAIAVGTQALIQQATTFGALALAIVDEQHRFGVQDRLKLATKGKGPHVLLMSATPIPRTLALAVHGDLDLSILDELPPGRTQVRTQVLSGKARTKGLEALKREVALGHQAYVVYPLVEESEKIALSDATQGAERLRKALPAARIALVHGRLAGDEREAAMAAFRRGEIDVLVATTVIEVGVDVPNATLMIVTHAERFGLAQLHQLRGRVGRGTAAAECLLLSDGPLSALARRRLSALAKSHDGFRLAEIDLELRGPGEVLGMRQSGLPEFAFADPIRQPELLARARQIAFGLVASDPELARPESQALVAGLHRLFGQRRSLASVG